MTKKIFEKAKEAVKLYESGFGASLTEGDRFHYRRGFEHGWQQAEEKTPLWLGEIVTKMIDRSPEPSPEFRRKIEALYRPVIEKMYQNLKEEIQKDLWEIKNDNNQKSDPHS